MKQLSVSNHQSANSPTVKLRDYRLSVIKAPCASTSGMLDNYQLTIHNFQFTIKLRS
jgi:hypothetical protein